MKPRTSSTGLGLRTLAYLLERGMPLHEAVDQGARVMRNRRLRMAWGRVGKRLRRGETFPVALEAEEGRLPSGMAELMKAGIETGTLGSVLAALATHDDLRRELRDSLRRTLLPVVPLLLATLVTGVLVMACIIPGFAATYENLRLPVPWHLRPGLIPLIWLGPAVAGLAVVLVGLHRAGALRPVRSVRRMATWSLATRGLGLLLEARVPLHTALGYLATADLPELAGRLEAGETLEGSVEDLRGIPESLRSVLVQGEKTGQLPECCAELSTLYKRLAVMRVRWIASRLAPALFAVAALMAGFTVLTGYNLYFKILADLIGAIAS